MLVMFQSASCGIAIEFLRLGSNFGHLGPLSHKLVSLTLFMGTLLYCTVFRQLSASHKVSLNPEGSRQKKAQASLSNGFTNFPELQNKAIYFKVFRD